MQYTPHFRMISNSKYLSYLLVFCLQLTLFACQNSNKKEQEEARDFLQSSFPDVLNLSGIPENASDRSVFMFSDKGAWFGYSLPDSNNLDLAGSFIGPFLMTQDNGIWISPVLSRLNLTDASTNEPIPLSSATIKRIHSYPGKLVQEFELSSPALKIKTELIFVSARTAITRLQIQNLDQNSELSLSASWEGNSFLEGVSFSQNEKGIRIHFSKNENIGMITLGGDRTININSENTSYQLTSSKQQIKAEPLEMTLAHTFCFSPEEWGKETQILDKIFQAPSEAFAQNESHWKDILNKVLLNLNERYSEEDFQRIAVKCIQTLTNNWRSSAGALLHDGLFPSYNYRGFNGFWSWDSWKHAVTLAYFDPQLAENQIRAMYDFQDEMGMIADCVYRDTSIEAHNWRNTKPPLSGWAIWEVFQKSGNQDFLSELLPKLEKYHQWWYQYRDQNQNGLCEYGSTDGSLIAAKWESGMDNAVRFDDTRIVEKKSYGGSLNIESADLNAYLCAEKQYLAKIFQQLGDTQKADQYLSQAKELQKQIQTIFYNEEKGWFFDAYLDTHEHLEVYGPEGWTPLWTQLATTEQAEAVRKTMLNPDKFATYIPFPTLAADHPKFKPNNGYWRGPIWMDQVYFGITALKNYGYKEDAATLSLQVFDRLEGLKNDDGPIRENYHPLTGKGLEANHFSWSAAHLLLLLLEE